MVSEGGLEPPWAGPIRPSTVRVCQFRHIRNYLLHQIGVTNIIIISSYTPVKDEKL